MDTLEPGEDVILEGRAGYETPLNRGNLILTNRRLIWEKSLSIDPFGGHELIIPLADIETCEIEGDALILDAGKGEVILFVDWLPLSLLSGGRRTKNWHRAITRAMEEAKTPA
jgi:hypothetical protein